MARIGKEKIEQLKETISLVRLVEASGVVLEKRGKDRVGIVRITILSTAQPVRLRY